jgi:hypothetical protein
MGASHSKSYMYFWSPLPLYNIIRLDSTWRLPYMSLVLGVFCVQPSLLYHSSDLYSVCYIRIHPSTTKM